MCWIQIALPATGPNNCTSWKSNRTFIIYQGRWNPARPFKCYAKVDERFLLKRSTHYHSHPSAHWAEVAWNILDFFSEICCAQRARFLFKRNPKPSTFYIKAMKSANSNFSYHFSGPAAALTLLLEGVIHSHPRPKQMSPNLTNQYCCLDALHLSRCFTEIHRWNSKKGKRTVNTSPVKCGPGCSFEELLWWLFAAIELSRGFRVQHTASSPGSFLYNTYKWENKITLDCTAAGCRRKAIK